MSRHEARQKLALEFGATDIIEQRGEEGAAMIKELTNGLGAESVIEAVGTRESMMQAIHATRPGGHVGYVGVTHGDLPGDGTVFQSHTPTRRARASSPLPAPTHRPHLEPRHRSRQGLRPHAPARPGRRRLPRDGRTAGHQDPALRALRRSEMEVQPKRPMAKRPAPWFRASRSRPRTRFSACAVWDRPRHGEHNGAARDHQAEGRLQQHERRRRDAYQQGERRGGAEQGARRPRATSAC